MPDTIPEIDLIAEMEKATAYKPEVNTPPSMPADSKPLDNLDMSNNNDDDFEPLPPEPEPEPEPGEEINAEELTDLIIEGSDMMMGQMFPYMYEKTLSANDRKHLRAIVNAYKAGKGKKEIVLNEEDIEYNEVYLDYDDYVTHLELTPKEKKNLRSPLKKVLSKVNFKTTPENALMAVAAMVLFPRLLPLIKNKMSK